MEPVAIFALWGPTKQVKRPSEVDMFRQVLAVPELTDHGSKKGLKREGLQVKTMFLFAPNKWEARKSGGKNMCQQFN